MIRCAKRDRQLSDVARDPPRFVDFVASLNFLISAGLVLPLPIGSAALFIAYAERSAAMAL